MLRVPGASVELIPSQGHGARSPVGLKKPLTPKARPQRLCFRGSGGAKRGLFGTLLQGLTGFEGRQGRRVTPGPLETDTHPVSMAAVRNLLEPGGEEGSR